MWGIFKNFFFVIIYLFGGAAVFCHTEKMRFLDSFYMCMISLSTVGYGDITPKTQSGRGFAIFYLPVGIVLLAQAAVRAGPCLLACDVLPDAQAVGTRVCCPCSPFPCPSSSRQPLRT